MKRTELFLKAHRIAKKILRASENYQIAFSFALMKVWQMAKAGHKVVTKKNIIKIVYVLTHVPVKQDNLIDGVPEKETISLF